MQAVVLSILATYVGFLENDATHPVGDGSRSREEHSRDEAQDHWEHLVLTELGDTSKLVTDLTQSQHMNLHFRQRIAEAAAGTLRKYLQHETFWSEWALECGINPGQLALADMADSLHGSPSRSFPRENNFSLRCHPKLEALSDARRKSTRS